MGNFLQNLFSSSNKKSFSTGSKKGSDEQQVSKKSSKKKKNSLVIPEVVTPVTAEAPKLLTDADFRPSPEPNSNGTPTPADSPFQRDFGPPSHEVLVALEKNRPRRSNIRRSSRHNQHGKTNTENGDAKILETTANDNEKDVTKIPEEESGEKSNPESPPVVEVSESPEPDTLDPAERNKVTRTKLANLFEKQLRQPLANNPHNHARKYQSVFEPSLDYFNNNNNNGNTEQQDSENETENDDSNKKLPNDESIFRRPRKTLPQGNSLLIDELKKRQSHFAFESINNHNQNLVNNDSNNNNDGVPAI